MKNDAWLVHFFRDRDVERDCDDYREEAFGVPDFSDKANEFETMKVSLYLGGVLNDCPVAWPWLTFNGLRAAVPATRNALVLMLDGGPKQRLDGVTSYGVAFLREEFEAAGARRASNRENYDLAWRVDAEWYFRPSAEDDYILCSTARIDHAEGPGLPLWGSRQTTSAFSKLYLIVDNEREAAQIRDIMTALYLMGQNFYDTNFDRTLCATTRIVVLQHIRERHSPTNGECQPTLGLLKQDDTLPAVVLADEVEDAEKIVRAAYNRAAQVAQDAGPVPVHAGPPVNGLDRYVRVRAVNVMDPMVQHLLKTHRAYLRRDTFQIQLDLDGTWLSERSIDHIATTGRQYIRSLSAGLGVELEVDLSPPVAW